MGSAVDSNNITRELTRYRDAGWGGVHIIAIYGAKGWEDKFISYLSPQWMTMLNHTVSEAKRLGLGVDTTTGSGWCFGGPTVSDQDANATAIVKKMGIDEALKTRFDPTTIQALVAFSTNAEPKDITKKIGPDGKLNWEAGNGNWQLYSVSQKPSGQKVKRASVGGQGHMLNLIYSSAMNRYLEWFENAFAKYSGLKPRAMYHDSYEYKSDWAPDFFNQFERRRGYRLEYEIPSLFGKEENDRVARVKCDYRETISDIMVEESLPAWVNWSHQKGMITRNEAHGSPGNLLDLYATADIPETEMFYKDRNRLVSLCASSAAHVSGKKLVACETGTWLKEHFTETLADMKYLLDDLFLSGVNHIFYHGTCYSPDQASWPGWLFYASYEMNPRNSVWRDVPVLNAYASRCQSVLQSGRPDNEILLYWPIHERWQQSKGLAQGFTVHARDWLEDQPFGKTAEHLWNRGFGFDYVSDRQLVSATGSNNSIHTTGGTYKIVLVPSARLIPLKTLETLLTLAESGANIIFEKQLPVDVPGWGNLELRQQQFKKLISNLKFSDVKGGVKQCRIGKGCFWVGEVEQALFLAGVGRETLVDNPGLMFIRRSFEGGHHYFIAHRGEKEFSGWITLSQPCQSCVIMDPMTGITGVMSLRKTDSGQSQVFIKLRAGESIILRTISNQSLTPSWSYEVPAGARMPITGQWKVEFLQGGPAIPPPANISELTSWTEFGGAEAQAFAGTARYTISFDAPLGMNSGWLDLGEVCQSARIRCNGKEMGAVIIPPFAVKVDSLKPKGNLLEVEVTSVAANRIRDLDRRKVVWKNFYDINFVNLNYKPFDASQWPITPAGLLGPVTLSPIQTLNSTKR